MTYLVRIVSGPAKGYEYVTSVIPDETIIVAPRPDHHGRGWGHFSKWMRVPRNDHPWPGERRYRRGELPKLGIPAPDELLTTDGEVICDYEHVE